MSDNGVPLLRSVEQEFSHYCDCLAPNEVIFPERAASGRRQYGVTVHRPACQWEIVAVEDGRTRHVVFVSAVYKLEQVLGLALGLGCPGMAG